MSDTTDDIEDGYDSDEAEFCLHRIFEIESRWKSGWHQDQDGNKIRLKDMTTKHVQACVSCFRKMEFDVSPFEKELKRRERLYKTS